MIFNHIRKLKEDGKKIGITFSTFDMLHAGHIVPRQSIMIKKFLFFLLLVSNLAVAREQITVEFSAGPSQPNTPAYLQMLNVANQLQNKYEFTLEFKPGAGGIIALQTMDQSPADRLSTVAPSFVENAKQGLINEDDYIPITSQGDACWAVITNLGDTEKGIASLRGQKEITVGGTGYGNAAHLTALIIGEQLGFKVRYIVYKANQEALVNMASGEPINFVLERVTNYQKFKEKNPRLQILGLACNTRNPAMPAVKTLREQGYNTPTIFLATVANIRMPEAKRKEIGQILDQAQAQLGKKYLLETSDMYPPMFASPKMSTQEFFNKRVLQMKVLTYKYNAEINENR